MKKLIFGLIVGLLLLLGISAEAQKTKATPAINKETIELDSVAVPFKEATAKRFDNIAKELAEAEAKVQALKDRRDDIFNTLCETNDIDPKSIRGAIPKPDKEVLVLLIPKKR